METKFSEVILVDKDELEEEQICKTVPIPFENGKIEFVAERYDCLLTESEIYRDIQTIEERLCGTEEFTNHADELDYVFSITIGILCGLIDSFFGDEFDLKDETGDWKSSGKVDELVIKVAQKCGYKGDNLIGAIKFLEDNYHIASDPNLNDFGGGKYHHLRDFAHHPNIIGLFFSVLTQFTGMCYGTDTKGLFQVVEVKDKSLLGENVPEKLLFGVIHWFYHMISDMAGSSSTRRKSGSGTGLPGPIVSFLKELSSLPFFQLYEGGNSEFSVFVSKLFDGRQFSQKIDLRAELSLFQEMGKQDVPVIINECFVRGFYFFRALHKEIKDKNISSLSQIDMIDFKKVIPSKNRTITRMLTISKGVCVAFDAGDAFIRSGLENGFNVTNPKLWGDFALRINFIGVASFSMTVIVDIKMGIKKWSLEKNFEEQTNLKLIRLYKRNAAGLSNVFERIPDAKNIPGPQFLYLEERKYVASPVKVMFVRVHSFVEQSYVAAKRTEEGLLSLLREYRDYVPTKDRAGKFARRILRDMESNTSHTIHPIWNSIHRFSSKRDDIFEAQHNNFNLFESEVRICNPDIVIFLTDRKYDPKIKKIFNSPVEIQDITECNVHDVNLSRLSSKKVSKIQHSNKKITKEIYRIVPKKRLKFLPLWFILAILGILLSLFFCFRGEDNSKIPDARIALPETKSVEFVADRIDFVSDAEAEKWFAQMVQKLRKELENNPSLVFEIRGYAAEFPNEIDPIVLASKRAEKVKAELVDRGVSEYNLKIVSMGQTNKWGNIRNNNRIVTIRSLDQ